MVIKDLSAKRSGSERSTTLPHTIQTLGNAHRLKPDFSMKLMKDGKFKNRYR